MIGPDNTVVLQISANPIHSRRVEGSNWYRTGFAFVGLHSSEVQKAVQAVLKLLDDVLP